MRDLILYLPTSSCILKFFITVPLEFIIILGVVLLSVFITLLILFERNVVLFLEHVLCGRE